MLAELEIITMGPIENRPPSRHRPAPTYPGWRRPAA